MVSPWLGMGLVLGALGGTAAGLRRFQCRRRPHPETVRKLFHVAGGVVCLGLPWLFDDPRPVAALTGIATLGFLVIRLARPLRRTIGSVVHAVARPSLGDLGFPLGVGLLFVLSDGDPLRFGVPVLVLTFADPAAALVGMRWGHHTYETLDGRKSLEGSSAFFVVALLCAAIPLLVLAHAGCVEALTVAALLALALTAVEAVAWRGLDNLLIPLAGFVGLEILL